MAGTGTSEDRPGGTELRTFLIADIRGYTTYTREAGDEAAAELATSFAALAREVVEARDGLLLELRGDEALAVFVSARQAVRAAVELQDRVREAALPRGVGVGLDAGEAVAVEGGFRGGALNLAARLCARAEAGEILASEAVIHLAARVEGVAYVDPRTLRLKGYEKPVRAVEVVPADRVPRGLSRTVSRARRRLHSRRRLGVALAAVLAVALAAALLAFLDGGTSGLAALEPGIALIDEESGEEIASIPQSQVKEPVEAIFAEGHFWVLNLSPLSFVQIEPKTGEIIRQIAAPVGDVGWFAVDGDTLWVTEFDGPGLSKVDISLGHEVERYDVAAGPEEQDVGSIGVAVGDGSVWVGRKDPASAILRLDPATGKVQRRISNVFGSAFLAYGDGVVWAAGGGGVNRIDTATNTLTRVEIPVSGPGGTEWIEAGGGFGWATNETKGEMYKLDRRGQVSATYRTGLGARKPSAGESRIWVGNQDVGSVTGIDVLSGQTTTYEFAHPIAAAAAGDGVVLVELLPGRTFEDRIAELSGEVVKLFVNAYQLANPGDPALDWNSLAFQVHAATCLKLLNRADAPAPDGWALRPEAAASLPTLSADRRTYTFTVKEGYAFSPPSEEPVTAETFRYSIERALSPKLGQDAPGPLFLGDIAGVQAFRDGKVAHIDGLRARGNTLTITLETPSPDFLERLALPFFCPVPTDTPLVPGGVAFRTGAGPTYTTPAAGPYYIADQLNGEYAILSPNPGYPGPRPQELDAIALREGVDPGLAVQRVHEEGWHGITNVLDPLLEPGGTLDRQWGPGSEAAEQGDQRYFTTPLPNLGYIAFNTGSPPFDDRRVRRAAALAMGRNELAAVWRQLPTDQLLPPLQPGFEDRELFALEPDLEQARRLMRGRRANAVMGIYSGCDPCREEAEALAAQLAPIGIEVSIEEFANPFDAARAGERIHLVDGGTALDVLDPASFLEQLVLEDLPRAWVSPSVIGAVEKLPAIAGSRRRREANALADRLATQEVPIAAVGVSQVGGYFAPAMGCRIFPPLGYGIDLAALCLPK